MPAGASFGTKRFAASPGLATGRLLVPESVKRSGVDLVWKDAHDNRDRDVLDVEQSEFVFPIETSRGGRG
jgi:hypothetical protein